MIDDTLRDELLCAAAEITDVKIRRCVRAEIKKGEIATLDGLRERERSLGDAYYPPVLRAMMDLRNEFKDTTRRLLEIAPYAVEIETSPDSSPSLTASINASIDDLVAVLTTIRQRGTINRVKDVRAPRAHLAPAAKVEDLA